MATIIAGRFIQQAEAEHAASALAQAGFDEDKISYFYSGPSGRHASHPMGGDHTESSGMHGKAGVAAGGTIGAVVGLAASPLAGPAGPVGGALLGAHVGNLIGTLSQTDEASDSLPIRQSGVMIAVEVQDESAEGTALDVLRSLGAVDLERADGTIEERDWRDFDGSEPPELIDLPRH
ncbi:MAG: hypothetical protein K0S28_1375 [Paucimonas sp.]|jgi:hypothetical protein|nr:hypothetical protein [Paucimonas sp.]